jgi:nicotinate phosphoribosyltransferase
LDQALEFLETLHFSPDELEWLRTTGRFSSDLIDYLAAIRFTGEVHALPEGTVFFANEPMLRVTAPLPVAQLVETRLINILHFQTLIASKAARLALLAPGKLLVDFGLRRAHEAGAGLFAARASYIGGFSGSATMLASMQFGIPMFGTMAHSFVQTFDDESGAFAAFARTRPDNLVLLIDTYDTERAARKVVELAPRLKAAGITISGVRLDSGDLIALSKSVRSILDEGGLRDVSIFASGGIDEQELSEIATADAPITGFGIGTSLTTSYDFPALDCAYKLQEYAGIPRRKHSTGKATWPGRKQVWRRYSPAGRMVEDVLSLETDTHEGEPLIEAAMVQGQRVRPFPTVADARARAAQGMAQLPEPLRRLTPGAALEVQVGRALLDLTAIVDRRLGMQDRR